MPPSTSSGRAGDVARARRAEEDRRRRHLLDRPEPADRDRFARGGLGRLGRSCGRVRPLRGDAPRQHRVDRHAVGRDALGEHLERREQPGPVCVGELDARRSARAPRSTRPRRRVPSRVRASRAAVARGTPSARARACGAPLPTARARTRAGQGPRAGRRCSRRRCRSARAPTRRRRSRPARHRGRPSRTRRRARRSGRRLRARARDRARRSPPAPPRRRARPRSRSRFPSSRR